MRSDIHHHSVPVLIRGLAAHASDCTRGVLTLYKNHLTVPAIPIVRAVMEDATTAAWLLVDADAWHSFISDGAVSRKKALKQMAVLNPSDVVIADRLSETDDLLNKLGQPSGHKIEQRMNSLAGAENMYLMYRAASAMSHADSAIVDLYTDADPNSDLGVVWRNHASFSNASAYIAVAATNLLHALLAWDTCLVDRPDQEQLERIAEEFGVRSTFERRA